MLPENHPWRRLSELVLNSASEIMIADHDDLQKALSASGFQSAKLTDAQQNRIQQLHNKLKKARLRVEKRHQSVPVCRISAELPISVQNEHILEMIQKHQVVIITGETGSGKTTQIPKMCLNAGFGRRGIIGLTQPRRIAAVTIASRIAAELGQECGKAVTYKIRFEEKTSNEPLIKVLTDGMLLAETIRDRNLLAYETIIVDEAHERSLNIDFLLGYLRTLLPKRKDLKLIVTSATIDTAKFASAFGNAPVIEVSGRMFPVEVRYQPVDPVREEKGETTPIDEAVACVEKLQQEGRFEDILIFLPTEQDIREACDRLSRRCSGLVLPLFARLSAAMQRQVFESAPEQKIIVATNIAETSLTIPGIQYVIDAGLARILEYNPRSQTTGLPVKPISKSSAEQRKGRCGRVQNGICIRLYSREEFEEKPLYTTPEILRSNLAGVILRMLALNLGEITSFPFIDRPHPKNIRDGIEILRDLGAVIRDEKKPEKDCYQLTDIGRTMSRYPLDPRVSRMIIEAKKEGCEKEIAVIAAALSVQDPRERPYDKINLAAAAHAQFVHPESDFLTYLKIWNRYSDSLEKIESQSKWRKFCRDHFLSYRRMREWRDIYHQILEITDSADTKPKQRKPAKIEFDQAISDRIHRCLLAGYLSNIAKKKEKNFYTATKSREVMLYPGSGLFNRGGTWIVASEISLTSRVFARNAANINNEWLEELGKEHCRYTHWAAHWEKNRGQVVALEKVTLFGLTIIEQRTVAYDGINPEEAKHIFIREALVTGEVSRKLPFLEHNLSLWEKVRTMEEKLRKRGIAVDEEAVARLYDRKLPPVSDIRTLQKLIKDRGGDDFLRFREEDFIADAPDPDDLSQFPDQIKIGSTALSCNYNFQPGRATDGVTVSVPLGLFSKAASENMEKHLPSLMEEKVLCLLKSLPKNVRHKLPPAVQVAGSFCRQTDREENALPIALSKFLQREYQLTVPADSWKTDNLPPHLNIRYRVIDDHGAEVKVSRNLEELREELVDKIRQTSMEVCRRQWEKDAVTSWDFGSLPESVELKGKHGLTGFAYPALQTLDGVVHLRLFADPREAASNHIQGVAALYEIYFAERLRQLKKNITLGGNLKNWAVNLGNSRQLEQSIMNRVKQDLFYQSWRSPDEFTGHARIVDSVILQNGQQVITAITPVLKSFADAWDTLNRLLQKNRVNNPVLQFLKATQAEMHILVPVNFPERYSLERLKHLPRYLKALSIRAERGSLNLSATEQKLRDASAYANRLMELQDSVTPTTSEEKKKRIDDLRWMIEEYKVSLFAQELKTPCPVSPKRLHQLIKEIENIIC